MTQNIYRKNADRFAKELQEYRLQRNRKVKSVIGLRMMDIFSLQKSPPNAPRPAFYPPTENFSPYKEPRTKIYDRSLTFT